MAVTYHTEFQQGSGLWMQQRCGMITASQMKFLLTPTLKSAQNGKERDYLYELLAQRATNHVEPQYISDAMLRGEAEETAARDLYSKRHAQVTPCGFITNDKLGFLIGYSPDGLVGDDGLIEIKSRRQKFQAETIIANAVPAEFYVQVQAGLFISERRWCDFISYCGGMPMFVLRVFPNLEVHQAIAGAATAFEARLREKLKLYQDNAAKFASTPRLEHGDIVL
jgi:hypothetical protein